jgi:hypothetical protein
VFAEQGVFGLLVMIEQNLFPALFVMASLTFGAESPLVLIFLLVAIVAQLGRVLVFIVDMALRAFHILVLAQQVELGLAVIEVSRLPVFFFVAILALDPEFAFVFV